jgi:hypothetical protein
MARPEKPLEIASPQAATLPSGPFNLASLAAADSLRALSSFRTLAACDASACVQMKASNEYLRRTLVYREPAFGNF